MTNEELALIRRQAESLKAQATAVVVSVEALLATLPAPAAPPREKPVPRTFGDDDPSTGA